ncbi:MAG: GyrI-like domain-containing protein [Oscillospiraceae bacterium]|nr:GyrI-like domain-containing protein [Oscillospiraceae bacterium]
MTDRKALYSQKQHGEFLFLGKLYTDENINFGKWYEDFNQTGGFEKINSCRKSEDGCLETVHFMLPKFWTVYIGIIVDAINIVPEGYISKKLPGGEFFVVASEWKPTNEEAHQSLDESEKLKETPNGYVEDDINYAVIEKFYECPQRGHKWERWYPIKKQ